MKNAKKDLLRDEKVRQAFAEIERTEAARFAALPDGDPSFSPDFEKRMDALLSSKTPPRRAVPVRRVIAAALAAALLFVFFVVPVSAGRKTAAGFLIEQFEKGSVFAVSTGFNEKSEGPSPTVDPLEFASWEELQNAFAPQNENNLCSYFSEQGAENKQLENIRAMVGKIQSGIPVLPCLDGNLIELRNETGFQNVVLFPSELYGLPWLWYFPACSGKNFYIQIACLPDGVLEKDSAPTASDVIKKLSPGSPNINNLGKQHKAIYHQELKLRDRTVTALITEYKSDSRNSIAFVYGELLVIVRCDPAVWSPEWFSALSFVPCAENAGS